MRARRLTTALLVPGLLGGTATAAAAHSGPVSAPVRLVVADERPTGEATLRARPLGQGRWQVTADVTKLSEHRGCVVLQADDGPRPGEWGTPRGQVLGMQCGTANTTTRMVGQTGHRELRLRWLPVGSATTASQAWVSTDLRTVAAHS
ncbi:hypothetical protein [Streptomyces sp. NPDC058045]|uniref:hypothetical protein n=1 Tax=Streptomyces sp. NPDC058045 TaxID=3346311 RepID=UPI0036EE0205